MTLIILVLGLVAAASAQGCWYPDGKTPAPDMPCNSNASVSACCNRLAFCLADGLCIQGGLLARGSCTDQSWNDPACPQYCIKEAYYGGVPLQPCSGDGSTWACWVNNTACQDADGVFTIGDASTIMLRSFQVAGLQPTGDEHVLGIESTSVIESNATSSSISTQPSTNSNSNYTAGQMAGVGVGVGIPLLLALIVALIVIIRQRKQLERHESTISSHKVPLMQQNDVPSSSHAPGQFSSNFHIQSQDPHALSTNWRKGYGGEMDTTSHQVNEVDGIGLRPELEGHSR